MRRSVEMPNERHDALRMIFGHATPTGKISFFLPETFTLILGIWGAVDSPRVENRRTLRFSFAFSES